ncbi:MAG: hypothetical protein ACKOJI_06785 [Phycisphaerales bacterium]
MRALEQAAIDTCTSWGLGCRREPGATGVWTVAAPGRPARKVAAIGVRVSRGCRHGSPGPAAAGRRSGRRPPAPGRGR